MVTSRFSLYPLSGMAGTTVKTLAIKFADGFLSGFCFVIFSFSRLTGPPPTQAAVVFHQPGIVETRNLVHEWTISLPPSLFRVFWFLVNHRPLPALEVCLTKVAVLHSHTYTIFTSLLSQSSSSYFYITLALRRLGSASVIHPLPLATNSLYLFLLNPPLVYLFDFVIYIICAIGTTM